MQVTLDHVLVAVVFGGLPWLVRHVYLRTRGKAGAEIQKAGAETAKAGAETARAEAETEKAKAETAKAMAETGKLEAEQMAIMGQLEEKRLELRRAVDAEVESGSPAERASRQLAVLEEIRTADKLVSFIRSALLARHAFMTVMFVRDAIGEGRRVVGADEVGERSLGTFIMAYGDALKLNVVADEVEKLKELAGVLGVDEETAWSRSSLNPEVQKNAIAFLGDRRWS